MNNEFAIIVFCSHLALQNEDVVKPFSISEWRNFADNLKNKKIEPSELLNYSEEQLKNNLAIDDTTTKRLTKLINRSASISFELQKLKNKGINIVTRANKDYPIFIKEKLGKNSPPLFYYSGNLNILKTKSFGFVGSRTISDIDKEITAHLIKELAQNKENISIVSGGAKGVDTIARETAFSNGFKVIEFLSDSLERRMKDSTTINQIRKGNLLLLSNVNPDAPFSIGNAMTRNKYIYSTSIATYIIKSDYNKGGTWTGALENLKNSWSLSFCVNNQDYKGNMELINKGIISIDINTKIDTKELEKEHLKLRKNKKKPNPQVIEQIKLF